VRSERRRTQRSALGVLGFALLAGLSISQRARAEPTPLSERRSERYYALHAGLIGGSLLATAVEELATAHRGPGYDLRSFGPDDAVRRNFSFAAASLSDKLVVLDVAMPVLLQMSDGFDTSMGNATLIYAEAQAFNQLASNTAKIIVRRPRPYTHSSDPGVQAFAAKQGSDAYASFYSAHASTAFTAALAGSILYSARTDELVARHTVWGVSFLLAGATAQLRVRAGRHYRTDIWLGTLSGLTAGLLVPALHRVDLGRVRGTELVTAGSAFAVSMLLSELVDFCGVLDALHLCQLPRDVTVPLGNALLPRRRWLLSPVAVPSGLGLALSSEL
jgi:membrane-associated phospholipid phosphatase